MRGALMATKRGRPALRAGEGKTERLHVLVTPLERDTLRTAAAAADVSEGEYVRRAVAYCAANGVPLEHVMPVTSTVKLSAEAMARLGELVAQPPDLTPEQRARWDDVPPRPVPRVAPVADHEVDEG